MHTPCASSVQHAMKLDKDGACIALVPDNCRRLSRAGRRWAQDDPQSTEVVSLDTRPMLEDRSTDTSHVFCATFQGGITARDEYGGGLLVVSVCGIVVPTPPRLPPLNLPNRRYKHQI